MAATARKKTREERREENRRRWEANQINANVRVDLVHKAPVPAADEPIPIDKLSIDALRELMNDPAVPAARRVEAAEVVLLYELPPAALSQASVDPMSSGAYLCLKKIAYTREVPDALRFRALKATSAIESAKPRKIDPQAAEQQRRHDIGTVNAFRRTELRLRGVWPIDNKWFASAGDVIDFPDKTETDGRGHTRTRTREELLSVRIKNRPDPWDTLSTRLSDNTE